MDSVVDLVERWWDNKSEQLPVPKGGEENKICGRIVGGRILMPGWDREPRFDAVPGHRPSQLLSTSRRFQSIW